MSEGPFSNVWDAISDTPEEAQNMTIRSELMITIREQIAALELSQTEAAKRLGVTQPRVSDLLRGKIDLFSVDALVNMAVALGLRVELRVTKPEAA